MLDFTLPKLCTFVLTVSLIPVYLTSSFPSPSLHHNILSSPLFSSLVFSYSSIILTSFVLLSSPPLSCLLLSSPHISSPPTSSPLVLFSPLFTSFILLSYFQVLLLPILSPRLSPLLSSLFLITTLLPSSHLFSSPLYNYKIDFYSTVLRLIRPVQIPAQSCQCPIL